MAALSFADARRTVVDRVREDSGPIPTETLDLSHAAGRVLAQSIHADRDYPPEALSMRDGYAVRSEDLPGALRLAGEIRAGQACTFALEPGQAIEIMTGATVPPGADAVVMVEHTRTEGHRVVIDRPVEAGANINPQGCDARAGDEVLPAGVRLHFAETALLASVGAAFVNVHRQPRVAILATGDELVELDSHPLPHQIRNSNSWSLAQQVARAGALPQVLPVAGDDLEATIDLIGDGLHADLLLISGGVSAGKYDLVELALKSFDATFHFDRVLLQPGQPCVFGAARGTFFFGLPGNPASTMVCFETLARAAVDILSGLSAPWLPLTWARLAADFRHKPGLTRFLPARLKADGTLLPVSWSGSGDLAALGRANAWLVADPGRAEYAAGDLIQVLLR
ncbi:MAG: molybdopterin molybdotransferase MoeA [Candidatus Solibacter usitatus]|nr:molybdopterin molybdotransferase MoeA [Candidatus Solibacter usitatus]